MCRLVLDETGLLPHANPGVMSRDELELLRGVTASQGIMLETISERLSERGGPHFGSPDKRPAARLETLRLAGKLEIPFTTGILIGIGETREERLEALSAIGDLHDRFGHIQEVIVQNFRAKPGTKMAASAEPPLDELLWTAAAARILLGPEMNIQYQSLVLGLSGPAQHRHQRLGERTRLTIDHVNPEAPWPEVERLAAATRGRGLELAPRLPVYPEFVAEVDRWCEASVATAVRRSADASGLARDDRWSAGSTGGIPDVWIYVATSKNGKTAGARHPTARKSRLDPGVAATLAKVAEGSRSTRTTSRGSSSPAERASRRSSGPLTRSAARSAATR